MTTTNDTMNTMPHWHVQCCSLRGRKKKWFFTEFVEYSSECEARSVYDKMYNFERDEKGNIVIGLGLHVYDPRCDSYDTIDEWGTRIGIETSSDDEEDEWEEYERQGLLED